MTAYPRLLLLLAFFGATTSWPAAPAAVRPLECASTSEVPRGQDCTDSHALPSGPTSDARFASPVGPNDPPKQAASHGPVAARRHASFADLVTPLADATQTGRPAPVYLITQRLRI